MTRMTIMVQSTGFLLLELNFGRPIYPFAKLFRTSALFSPR